jgi:hypothetical protein
MGGRRAEIGAGVALVLQAVKGNRASIDVRPGFGAHLVL